MKRGHATVYYLRDQRDNVKVYDSAAHRALDLDYCKLGTHTWSVEMPLALATEAVAGATPN